MLGIENDFKWKYGLKYKSGKCKIEIYVLVIFLLEFFCLWVWVFKLINVR